MGIYLSVRSRSLGRRVASSLRAHTHLCSIAPVREIAPPLDLPCLVCASLWNESENRNRLLSRHASGTLLTTRRDGARLLSLPSTRTELARLRVKRPCGISFRRQDDAGRIMRRGRDEPARDTYLPSRCNHRAYHAKTRVAFTNNVEVNDTHPTTPSGQSE